MHKPLYHPDSRYLNDYCAGTLDLALSITVKTHLEFCAECRYQAQQIQQVGAWLLENEPAENVSANLLNKVFEKIDAAPEKPITPTVPAKISTPSGLPKLLDKLMGESLEQRDWTNIGRKLRFSRVKTGDRKNELGLYHIKAGGKVPNHKHHCDEITVVLKGSFSDGDGVYKKGDFVVRTQGEQHSLTATQDEDCLCLSAIEKPIAFTGIYRLLNPLLKVQAQ